MKIQGHLRDYPLDDLFEILVNRHESGCLRIGFEPEPARLYFDEGTLVDASMSFLRGFPAVHLAFSRADAPFDFDNQVPPPAVAMIDENERQLLSEMLKVRLSGENEQEMAKSPDETSVPAVEPTPEVNLSVFAKAIESASTLASPRASGIRQLLETTFNRRRPRPPAVGTSTPPSDGAPGIRHLFETTFNRSLPRPTADSTSAPASHRTLGIRHLLETTYNRSWPRLAAVGTSILASLRALEIRHLLETTFNRSWSRLAAVGASILASLRALEIRRLFETTFNRSWSRLAAVGTSLLNLLNQVPTRTLLRAAAMVLAVAIPVTVGITVFLAKKNASEQVVAATPESKSVAETTAQPVAETKPVESAVTPPSPAQPEKQASANHAAITKAAAKPASETPKAREDRAAPVRSEDYPKPKEQPRAAAESTSKIIVVSVRVEEGHIAEAWVKDSRKGLEAYEATAIRLARQRRYPAGASRTESVPITVTIKK